MHSLLAVDILGKTKIIEFLVNIVANMVTWILASSPLDSRLLDL